MTPEMIGRFLGSLVPLIGSAIQVWATLLKRSNWIARTENIVKSLGPPFAVLDKFPLKVSYFLLVLVIILSLLALVGGVLISSSIHAPMLLKFLFENALWLTVVFVFLAVITHLNLFPRLLLFVSRRVGYFWRDITYHPGWINAFWHIHREDDAVPINTNVNSCHQVANDLLKAVAIDGIEYDLQRATKPTGLSDDELANFLVIANAIESETHRLGISETIRFSNLYKRLGEVGLAPEKPFSPETLRDLSINNRSLYALLQQSIPDLPDQPAIEGTITNLVKVLVISYSGQSLKLARVFRWFNVVTGAALDRSLRKLPAFSDSQPMRAQVIKLAIEWKVWPKIQPGPFIYPFSRNIARLLLNLDCLQTRPDVKVIPCDDEFIRLSAWTVDRIVDEFLAILTPTTDSRIVSYCQNRFSCPPSHVLRWSICREIDYLLWEQSRGRDPKGSIFGARATTPWEIEGNSLTKS